MGDNSQDGTAEAWGAEERTWNMQVQEQLALLPAALRSMDRALIKATEVVLVGAGVLFTLLIAYDVVARYAFGASSLFVSAAAKFLLLWFFLLGAGLALRQGSHVGFELVAKSLPFRTYRVVRVVAQLVALGFFAQMLWSGVVSLGPAARQNDPALNLSLFWAFLAMPVGFTLLIYHQLVLMLLDRFAPSERAAP
ncbi:TRAP transporter small permease [Bosea beijingensis]|uniref:TRAP transporter small permease n=1 Tax=Bosea beijingensis TaxID=3068632 RepID=UPI002741A92E|nr:TRAP transporter small permease subunit [Bosea sp. REN20]